MMRTFRGYPEISILNPQMRYFQKNVNYPFFKNGDFGGYDLENWVWTKSALWICPNLRGVPKIWGAAKGCPKPVVMKPTTEALESAIGYIYGLNQETWFRVAYPKFVEERLGGNGGCDLSFVFDHFTFDNRDHSPFDSKNSKSSSRN